MLPVQIFVFCVIITAVASEKSILKNSKTPRFISFDSASNDIEVSLDFSIPFIKIPFKKDFNLGSGLGLGLPQINLNPSSLVFGGVMVLVTSLLATFFNGKNKLHHPYPDGQRYSRDDVGGFMAGDLLDIANTLASNSHSCPSKLACWVSRNSGHERLEIWRQIIRNKLLSTMLNTTAVEYAFAAGRSGVDCESFAPCPLNEKQFARLGGFNL